MNTAYRTEVDSTRFWAASVRWVILTDPLKFWVIILVRLPTKVMGLRYQTSETAASTTALADRFVVFGFVPSFGVSVVVDIVAVGVVVIVGVLDPGWVVIRGLGFVSGL